MSADAFETLSLGSTSVTIDLSVGNIRNFTVQTGGRPLAPFHQAHWVGKVDFSNQPEIPPVDQNLSGDFFCAPFGASNSPDVPAHGWTANSLWNLISRSENELDFELARGVRGARVTKQIRLRVGDPVLYQTHKIFGGQGGLTLSHHPMFHLSDGGRMSFSPKRAAISPDDPLEPGRNWLSLGARSDDLTKFPTETGTADLTKYPTKPGHEDFVTLVEQDTNGIGWTAILRDAEDDMILILKDARVLPTTMLWFSNGGRDQFPWNGQHTGVLGVEDGIAAGAAGYDAAQKPNRVTAEGVKSAIQLAKGTTHTIKHAIAVVPRPMDWACVDSITISDGAIQIKESHGHNISIPFDCEFFK